MASVTATRWVRCLVRKLQAQEVRGKHRGFEIYDDDGLLVARTSLSRSWRGATQLSDDMVRVIRQELNLSTGQSFAELIACPLSRAEYLRLVSD